MIRPRGWRHTDASCTCAIRFCERPSPYDPRRERKGSLPFEPSSSFSSFSSFSSSFLLLFSRSL
jgi:hypothetical protein